MIGSFVRLFALSVTFALGCTAIGLSAAIAGLWLVEAVQDGGQSLHATLHALIVSAR
ncbi:MAG: hypothetical protein IT562_23910 [Alphaproteobacteria bacterium]|nr:hypothetical protein [Alphaproteobacteria bacterium]